MILDSSVLIAILFDEPEADGLAATIAGADRLAMAAPTLVEATMVTEGRASPGMREKLEALMATIDPEVVPFTAEHAGLAIDGWRRFGKGRHPAGLNLGDCFAYALAKARGEPLLFKGDDFARTDVKVAI
ncbi:type II toxin-antitoxin system VapC family toxin [Humitalea sp. 24SJ18S-53]|uniref:type II toxin-antitoxin system VapC family toxin n=1 Tax=Humitalea sp. 24SJ18S-53 TaxID=3422307 RepID=UPI003D6691F2